jgi:hypothetical protein
MIVLIITRYPSFLLDSMNVPQEHARRRTGSRHNVDWRKRRHDGYLKPYLKGEEVKGNLSSQQPQATFFNC